MLFNFIKLLFITAFTFAFVMFAVANRGIVAISLFPLPYDAEMPVFLLAVLCVALGAVIGGLVMSCHLSKRYLQLRREHKRAEALENELAAMRAESSLLPVRP